LLGHQRSSRKAFVELVAFSGGFVLRDDRFSYELTSA
jgi:hypothetical protein